MRLVVDVGSALEIRAGPPGAHIGETRILLDLNAPTMIFYQVPVENIHFMHSQVVDEFLDVVYRIKVATYVKHQPSPAEPRLINNFHGGNRYGLISGLPDRQQLIDGLYGIKQAIDFFGMRRNAIVIYKQAIALVAKRISS